MKALILLVIPLFLVGCFKETRYVNEPLRYHLGDIVEVTNQEDFYFGCYGVVTGVAEDQRKYFAEEKIMTSTPRYYIRNVTCPKLKNIKGMDEKSVSSLISTQTTLSLKK